MRETQRKRLVDDIDYRRAGDETTKTELRLMLAEAVRNTATPQNSATSSREAK